MRLVLCTVCVVLAATGCGSSKTQESQPNGLPRARTADEWAQRVVNRVLRPLNADLVVVNTFETPQVRLYLTTRNEQALRTIHGRLGDLQRCTSKLETIGPPPSGERAMRRVDGYLHRACASYEQVADRLLEATDLLTSNKSDRVTRAEEQLRAATPPSQNAARMLTAGIKIAQTLAPFRRAGLQPSV